MKRKFLKGLAEKLNDGYIIKINIFNMDYIIKKETDQFMIYSCSDKNYKKYYNSLESMFEEFKIYSVSLNDNIDKIKFVSEELII